jgi:hypothetical protein
MANIATIQSKINRGYGKAGAILGDHYLWLRANGPNYPTMRERALGIITAQFATDPGTTFAKPSQYGKPDWYGAFDATFVAVSDYLVGPQGTFFVVATERLNAPHVIRCNHIISVARAADTLAAGSSGVYSGSAVETAEPFMIGWPCYCGMLSTGRGSQPSGMALPSDTKLPEASIFLPGTCPELRFNDIVSDDNGVRYTLNSVELSPLGYRLTASIWPSA